MACQRTYQSPDGTSYPFFLPEQSLIGVINEVQYQTEKATQDNYLSIQRPSTVALTILIKALQQRSSGF